MTGSYIDELEHPEAIAIGAAIGFAVSYLVALQTTVPTWEIRLTEWINGVPDAVGTLTYPVMQLGTLAGPLIVASAIVIVRRDLVLSAAVVVTGVLTWFGAKGVKRLVERGRPLEFIADLVVREGDGSGLGYVSGHSAVAATTAMMAMVALPRRARPFVAALAGMVGIARIVHGVHLPADVVGGWCFGALMGLGGLVVAGAVRGRGPESNAGPG